MTSNGTSARGKGNAKISPTLKPGVRREADCVEEKEAKREYTGPVEPTRLNESRVVDPPYRSISQDRVPELEHPH